MSLPRALALRFTGPAGPPVVFDMTAYRHVSIAGPVETPIMIEHQMLDYSMKQDRIGFQQTVPFTVDFYPGSAEDAGLAAIAALLMDDAQTIEITLDFAAADPTWKTGYFRSWHRAQTAGKDAHWTLSALFVCERLLQPGTVGPLAGRGQAGHFDQPGPPAISDQGW